MDSGKETVAVIEFDSFIAKNMIQKDGQGDDYHTTVTVFAPDKYHDGEPFDYDVYLAGKASNYELKIIKESSKTETAISQTEATVSESELSNNSIRNPEGIVNKNSLSAPGQVEAAGGGWNVRGRDVSLPGYQENHVAGTKTGQTKQVNLPGLEKSQPQSQGKAQSGNLPMPKQTPKDQQTAAREALHEALFGKQQTGTRTRPAQQTTQQEVEDLDEEYRRQMGDNSSYYDPAEGEEIETARERLEVQRNNLQIELRENQRLRQEVIEEFDRKIEAKQAQYDAKKHKHSKTAQALLRDIEKLKRKKADQMAEFDKAIAQIERRHSQRHLPKS